AILASDEMDCVALDLELPDMTALELAETLVRNESLRKPPVVIFSPDQLPAQQESTFKRLRDAMPLVHARSPERLIDLTTLFLHRELSTLHASVRETIEHLHQSDAVLAGRKVLVVDDDIRNIFALTSILERQSMVVLSAENGRSAIDILERTGDVDI